MQTLISIWWLPNEVSMTMHCERMVVNYFCKNKKIIGLKANPSMGQWKLLMGLPNDVYRSYGTMGSY